MTRFLPRFIALSLVSQAGIAMQVLDDTALSAVAGQDGLTISLDGAMSADNIQTVFDSATVNAATLSADTITVTGVLSDGTVAGAPAPGLDWTLDAGTGELQLGLSTSSRTRIRADSLTIPSSAGVAGRSYGTWAFDVSVDATLWSNDGLLSMNDNSTYLFGEISDADLFYRQGSDANAWMGQHDFLLRWEVPDGIVGICGATATFGCDNEAGIVHRAGTPREAGDAADFVPTASSIINLALDFEYIFGKKEGAEEFQITPNARGILHFGWLGSVKDAELKWMSGGSSNGATLVDGTYGTYFNAYAATTQGIRFSSQWDFVSRSDALALGDSEKEFRWRLGETADVASADKSRINFELGDWTIWGTRTAAKPSSHYFPLIVLDVINANQGPGGLCWGHGLNLSAAGCDADPEAQFVNIRPGTISNVYGAAVTNTGDASSLALIIRDGQLQSYSRKVRLLERPPGFDPDTDPEPVTREFNWGLIYALANVDANIYLYPGGSGTSGEVSNGVIADILVVSQTLDEADPFHQGFNWDHGTHLMLADTDANMGIGFLSSSFVVAGNDTRIWVRNQEASYDSNADGVINGLDNPYFSGGLDFFSPEARFNYRATFGGGLLPGHPNYLTPGQPQTVRGFLLDMNLEGMVNLRFSPSDPNEANNRDGARNFLAYSGALRLGTNASTVCGAGQDCGLATDNGYGSYISIAEPNRPDVDVRFANITGDLAFTEGQIDLVQSGENGADRPSMKISNIVHVGYDSAVRMDEAMAGTTGITPAGGQPVIIDNILLGQARLGSVVIPSARIYSAITLEPQTPN